MKCLVLLLAMASAATSLLAGEQAPKWIADLSSDDGPKRVAATQAAFELGKDALDPLRAAGAKQISPFGTIATRRIDMVYSLIDGLRPNPPGARAGYSPGGFGLHVAKGFTREDAARLGEKYGFTLSNTFNADGVPACYVQIAAGKNLAEVIKAILTKEPQILSINLNYVER